MGLLSILIFLPLLATAIILALPTTARASYKYIALGFTAIQFILSAYMYTQFNPQLGGINEIAAYQYVEQLPWIRMDLGSIGKLEIDYFIGIDGISLPLIVLSSLVMLMGIGASWNISKSLKGYFALLMVLNTAVIGIFCTRLFPFLCFFMRLCSSPYIFLLAYGEVNVASMQPLSSLSIPCLDRSLCCLLSSDSTSRSSTRKQELTPSISCT